MIIEILRLSVSMGGCEVWVYLKGFALIGFIFAFGFHLLN